MSACPHCGKEHPGIERGQRVIAALTDAMAELNKANAGPEAVSADVRDIMHAARFYQKVCGKGEATMQAEFLGFMAGAFYCLRRGCS